MKQNFDFPVIFVCSNSTGIILRCGASVASQIGVNFKTIRIDCFPTDRGLSPKKENINGVKFILNNNKISYSL